LKVLQVLILVGPFILFSLPATYFDKGESICLSIRLFNVPCFGCGLTRAIMHLIHFDFKVAWNLNKIAFILFPIGLLFWFHLFGNVIDKPIFTFLRKLY
jgi:hypothetical protein